MDNSCDENAQCAMDDDFNEICICTLGYEYIDSMCQDINECESNTHKCGDSACFNLEGSYRCTRVIDVLWAIDGTGSYKSYGSTAQANFKEQIEFFNTKNAEGMKSDPVFLFVKLNLVITVLV